MANNNGAAQQRDWQAEATFWQLRYFEQLLHSTQVITALSRPMIGQVRQAQAAAQVAAQQQSEGMQI